MTHRLVKKLAVAQERRRLTVEYLGWARTTGDAGCVLAAERDLVRHDHHVAFLQNRLTLANAARATHAVRALLLDLLPAGIFFATAATVTALSRWDAGVVGLLGGLVAALTYLYFAKDTGRLRW